MKSALFTTLRLFINMIIILIKVNNTLLNEMEIIEMPCLTPQTPTQCSVIPNYRQKRAG